MDFYTFMSAVFEHITVPIIILIGGVIIAVLKPYANKITNSLTMKNEMESLEKMTKAKSNLMEQLDKLVESAVASNMQLADKMKENGHKLTEDEIAELNRSAKDLVVSSLPIEVLDHEGDLYKLIGGDEKLDKMIMRNMYIFINSRRFRTWDLCRQLLLQSRKILFLLWNLNILRKLFPNMVGIMTEIRLTRGNLKILFQMNLRLFILLILPLQ